MHSTNPFRCLRVEANGETLAAILEKHAALQSPSQIESLVKIFLHATKVCGFIFSTRQVDFLLTVEVDGDGILEYGQRMIFLDAALYFDVYRDLLAVMHCI